MKPVPFPHRPPAPALVAVFALFGCALVATPALPSRAAAAEIDFHEEVRPILAEKCTLCHGPDEAKAGLRLTNLEEASRTLRSGAVAVLPGKPEDSELLARVHSSDPDEVMPPPDAGEPLTEAERETLRRWIAAGAPWPQHWAYAPLAGVEIPATDTAEAADGSAALVRNPVDAFVFARLEKERIAPSPEADPRTLVRRLHYDLVGLPPERERVARFLEDWERDADAAYSQLVDELLASPRFGERWGRHWLDKARYADSDGFEKDNHRPDAWRYRDWVIDAFNRDLPFDRFTVEQIAGDLLPGAGPGQLVATAFHRQTLTNTEGGVDREQWRVAAVMDRAETLGAVWLGLTVSCARCHTHKYDEITHEEYFQLYAYFDNADETTATVPVSVEAWAGWEKAHAAYLPKLEAQVADHRETLAAAAGRRAGWEAALAARLAEAASESDGQAELRELPVEKAEAPARTTLARQDDGSYLAGGNSPATATYVIQGTLPPGRYDGLRLEALPDPSLGGGGPGRARHGNFVLNALRWTVDGAPQVFGGARASHAQGNYPAEGALDDDGRGGREGSGWAVGGRAGEAHEADFGLAEPLLLDAPAPYRIELAHDYGGEHTLGRFRLSLLSGAGELIAPAAVREALSRAPGERDEAHETALAAFFEKTDPGIRASAAALAKVEAARPAPPEMELRVVSERREDRRVSHILNNGEFLEPLEPVVPGTFAALPPIEHRGPEGDRLDLARWLVDGENPLPPRVVVNQIWTHLFGEGLVATVEDFGVRGDLPSHPELLDWLARHWTGDLAWSVKGLLRTLVHSQVYRQRSEHRPELLERDPRNRLLARQNRFRVEAEIVRDLSLSAAGLLSDKVGGPSVFPPIPAGATDVNYNSAFQWRDSEGEDRYRRGLYTYFKRTAPHPSLMTFDCPDSNVTALRRNRSNTPLAALVTLNNEVYHEAALAFARRVLEAGAADDGASLRFAFETALARPPAPAEGAALLSLLQQSRDHYRSHPEDAAAIRSGLPGSGGEEGDEEVDAGDEAELAAWTATLRAVLNLDEFLTRG